MNVLILTGLAIAMNVVFAVRAFLRDDLGALGTNVGQALLCTVIFLLTLAARRSMAAARSEKD